MNKFNRQSGFSLLEVMIAVMILAIGLLGMAAMQALALSSNQEAQFRVQALAIAEDLASRMRANRNYVNASVNKFPNMSAEDADGYSYNVYSKVDYNDSTPPTNGATDTEFAGNPTLLCGEPATDVTNLNCRALADVIDIKRQLNPTTTGRLLPADSLMFVDCNDKVNSDYTSADDADPCSPGSVYTIYVIWPMSAGRADAGQRTSDGDNRQLINTRCATRLTTYNSSAATPLLPRDAGCVIMDIVP